MESLKKMEKLPLSNRKIRQGLRRSVVAGILVVVIGGLAVSANALLASGRDTLLPGSSSGAASIVIQGNSGERVEAELITIRPTGFDPVEIRRPRGRFILVVNNRSGIHELDLRLDREAGARQEEVQLPRGRQGWKKIVDLSPGRYLLTEAKHPDWICRIIITPN